MIAPTFEELAEENKGLIFVKVDVDSCDKTTGLFKIQAMPTFVIYDPSKKDEPVPRLKGASKAALKELVGKAAAL